MLAPPVDTTYFRPTHEPRDRFVLVVAALAPYKKVDVAIEACRRAGVRLVVVGDGPERARLEQAGGPSTRFAGRVGPAELRRLYSTASCYLQSGIEDFGIATVRGPGLRHAGPGAGEGGVLDIVEHGRHGLLVDEPGVETLAAAIDKIQRMQFNLMDLRSRAEEFSAERFTTRLKGYLRPFWPESEGESS